MRQATKQAILLLYQASVVGSKEILAEEDLESYGYHLRMAQALLCKSYCNYSNKECGLLNMWHGILAPGPGRGSGEEK